MTRRRSAAGRATRILEPQATRTVYIEANNKVCMDAFLAIRGRKNQREFINYFTGTICSVPQFLDNEQYRELSVALLDPEQWESLKSLSLLALSAVSQAPSSMEKKGDE